MCSIQLDTANKLDAYVKKNKLDSRTEGIKKLLNEVKK